MPLRRKKLIIFRQFCFSNILGKRLHNVMLITHGVLKVRAQVRGAFIHSNVYLELCERASDVASIIKPCLCYHYIYHQLFQ